MITIKPMRLKFLIENTHWIKRVELLDGTTVFEERNVLLPDMRNPTYFDEWVTQAKNIPAWNIVEVVRVI